MKKTLQSINKKIVLLAPLILLICSSFSFFSQEADDEKEKVITDAQARLELGRVLSYQKKYDEALNEFEEALKENPDLLDAKIEQAKAFVYKGEKAKGLAIIENLPPKDIDDKTKLFLAITYGDTKQYDKSENLFQELLKKYPENLKIKLKYAEMLSWEKKYTDSIQQYEEILQKKPDDIQIRRKYALVLIWNGEREQGAHELRRTLSH